MSALQRPGGAPLFPTRIRENLRIARPDAADPELWAALERAQCAGRVAALPEGLDTRLVEDGAGISGGQRQRLGVARALLADVRPLVLDEPAGVSGLLITHRRDGLETADAVLELRDGRLS